MNKIVLKKQIEVLFWSINFARKLNPLAFPLKSLIEVIYSLKKVVYLAVSAVLIDDVIVSIAKEMISESLIFKYLFLYLATHLFFEAFLAPSISILQDRINITRNTKLQRILSEKTYQLGIQASEDHELNDLRFRVRKEIYNVSSLMDYTFLILQNILRILTYSAILLTLSPWIILAYLIAGIIYTIPMHKFRKEIYKIDTESAESNRKGDAALNAFLEPLKLQDLVIMRLGDFFKKIHEENVVNKYFKKLIKVYQKENAWYSFFNLILIFLNLFFYYVVINFAINKLISPGQILFYIGNLDAIYGSFTDLFRDLGVFQDRLKRTGDVMNFLKKEPIVKDGNMTIPQLNIGPSVSIKNVSFKYPKTEKYVLRNLNLNIKSKEKIALIGANGSGKTTLLKLICRFYDVSEGEIEINGTNIKNIRLDDLYKNLSFLLQEFNSFNFLTLRDNIRIGDIHTEYNENKVILALEKADIIDNMNQFENFLDKTLSPQFENGIKPSVGQAQKIAIARFFYRNSSLIIFDEPSSSIDAISEAKIFSNIYSTFTDKTVIIISHRFSTVSKADRIIVMDKGEIIEQGSHSELMKIDGVYAASYKLQTQTL